MEEDTLAVVHMLVAAHTVGAEENLDWGDNLAEADNPAEADNLAGDYKHVGEVVLVSFEWSALPEQAQQWCC